MSGTAEPGQDQVTETEAVQPAVPAGQGDGPWADKLNASFEDAAIRGQVDAFLRGEVQPYVTQLEQSRNPDAEQLYSSLNESPGETFLAIANELWGEDGAEAVREALLAQAGDTPTDEPPPAETPPAGAQPAGDGPLAGLDPSRVERVVKSFEDTERIKQYNDALTAFKTNGHEDVVDQLFAPFVTAAGGDFKTAYVGYSQWLADFKAQAGAAEPTPEGEPTDGEPPAVLGSDTTATTAPPVTKRYESLDDALDAFLDESKTPAPTPVGST